MFNFIKNTLTKVYSTCTSKFNTLFTQITIDETLIKELERILIEADTGFKTTQQIIKEIKDQSNAGAIQDGNQLRIALKQQLMNILSNTTSPPPADIYLLIGVNGSGKTTFAAKLAQQEKNNNKSVLLVAADTLRAAAQEQLALWAQKVSVDIETGKLNQDPAAVVYTGCQRFKNNSYQTLIIDTAGRLQTKTNLMKELEKIKHVITQQLPKSSIHIILTVDAMLGQNSLEQARVFNECSKIDSITLTKMDGTGKGGIVFAIAQELGLPVSYITFGEQVGQIKSFDAKEYISDLIGL